MKIFFDGQTFQNQKHGGISWYFFNLIHEMALLNPQNNIQCLLGVNQSAYTFTNLKGLSWINSPLKTPKARWLGKVINRTFYDLKNRLQSTDIYHPTYYKEKSPWKYNQKVITVHDMIHELYPHYFAKHDHTAHFKKKSILSADKIIAVSDNTKEDILKFYPEAKEKVYVVYHGGPNVLSDLNIEPSPKNYILYVGSRFGYKNFFSLLDAYSKSQLPRLGIKLCCFGGGEFNQAELNTLKALNIQDDVYFKQGTDKELHFTYQRALAHVIVSQYEGFGLTPLEAMANHCPVLLPRLSSLPEVAGNAGIYFESIEKQALITGLNQLIDSELIKKHIKLGLVQASKFSWQKCARQTLDLYAV